MAAERLDVDIHVQLVNSVAEGADSVFEFGGAAMRFTERKIFVDLEVEFDEQAPILLIGGDVMDGMTHALGDCSNGFEQMLVVRSARFSVDNDIRGHDLADAVLDGVRELVDLFEAGRAGDRDGGVNEMAIAGAPDAHTFNVKNAVHASDDIDDLVLQAFGGGVEEGIERAAAEL